MIQYINNIPELQSPFEQLKEVDANGKEWGTHIIGANNDLIKTTYERRTEIYDSWIG